MRREQRSALAFQGQHVLGFALSIVVEGQGEAAVLGGAAVRGSGRLGPVENLDEGALMELASGQAEATVASFASGRENVRGASELAAQRPGAVALPELAEAVGQTGKGGVAVFADLAAEGTGFVDEVAALAYDEL